MKAGWPVVEMGVDSDTNGYENARQLIRLVSDGCVVGPVDSIVLIGQNCGGRFSFMIGQQFHKVKKVVTIGAYASWPIKKLSPIEQEEGMNCPEVLILNGGSDWRTDIDEAYALESICNKRGIPCRLQIVPDVGNDLERQRGDVIIGLLDLLRR